MKRVGILFHPKKDAAPPLANEISRFFTDQGVSCWQCSAWAEEDARPQVDGSDLIFSIGGDGTILRAARISAPFSVPLLGINLGRLGFMTELGANEILAKLPQVLAGDGWIDDRAMLRVEVIAGGRATGKTYQALNDIVVSRRSSSRVISIEARLDGAAATTYRADGLIVATATGSTGYSLAAGGPILYPQSREVIMQPICPHLSFNHGLVLSSETRVDLKVFTLTDALLSIDGQIEMPLASGDGAAVRLGTGIARFLRLSPRSHFYATLAEKLKGTKS